MEELFASLAWLAANGLYIDLRRKGRKGWARFFFFWMGIPATWLWLFFVPEGKGKAVLPTPTDDFAAILREIRRDKALRSGVEEEGALDAASGSFLNAGEEKERGGGRPF